MMGLSGVHTISGLWLPGPQFHRRRSRASTTPSKLPKLELTTLTSTPNLSAPAAVTGPCAATTSRARRLLTAAQSQPISFNAFSRPSTSPLLVKTTASKSSTASAMAVAQSAPNHRVSYASTLTGTHPAVSSLRRNRGTTGGSLIPTTFGTGQRIWRPRPGPNVSTNPSGVGTEGTISFTRPPSVQNCETKSRSIRSASLPMAPRMNSSASEREGKIGFWRAAMAAEIAEIEVRDGNAMAERRDTD